MSFLRLSDQVDTARQVPQPPSDLPFRTRAGTLAGSTWGIALTQELPALINVAGLALSMTRLAVHELTGGAIGLVHSTDLRSLPGEPPRLLRAGWIVESARMTEPLFGATICLGGYPLEDAIYLVGMDWPDGALVAKWRPVWGEREIEVQEDHSPLIEDVDAHHEWAQEAARFAVVLALLLEAEKAPLETKEPRRKGGRRIDPRTPKDWSVRRLSLTSRPAVRGPVAAAGGRLPDGLIPQQTYITGFLRRQPYGPGRSERRWIYVQAYEARRWVAPKIRIHVRP